MATSFKRVFESRAPTMGWALKDLHEDQASHGDANPHRSLKAERDKLNLDAVRQITALQIRATRLQRNWTQEELGKRCDMAQPAIARLESGEHLPDVETLTRVAAALDVAAIVRFEEFHPLSVVDAKNDPGLKPGHAVTEAVPERRRNKTPLITT
jgi:transcriptional regulator with XRE-family HTH domain